MKRHRTGGGSGGARRVGRSSARAKKERQETGDEHSTATVHLHIMPAPAFGQPCLLEPPAPFRGSHSSLAMTIAHSVRPHAPGHKVKVVRRRTTLVGPSVLLAGLALTSCTRSTADTADPPSSSPTFVEMGPMTDFGVAPPGSSLLSIDGSASNDIWAVGESHRGAGERSFAEHWTGSTWSVGDVPNVGRLMDVTAVEADDVWAVSISSALHWDGATWNSEDLSKGNARSLSSISATVPDDVWVVGERPGLKLGPHLNGWSTLVMHFDGHRWIEQDTPDQGRARPPSVVWRR